MPLFKWSSRYSVGVERFDAEHQRLFDLMNQLHDARRVGQERTVLDGLFREIIEYTDRHFSAEEAIMGMHGYPEAAAHKAEHDLLRSQSAELQAKYISGTSKVSIDVLNFLLRWWTDHILRTDRQYSEFLAPRVVKHHPHTAGDLKLAHPISKPSRADITVES